MSEPYIGKEPPRKCHYCGKATSDYMCRECWIKRQGFHPNDRRSSDSESYLAGGGVSRKRPILS